MRSILKDWVISFEFYEWNIDSKKYISILEHNINKIKEMFPKNEYFNEIMIVTINQMYHKNSILQIKLK